MIFHCTLSIAGNLAGMGGWGGSKPTTPMGGTPMGGTPLGGSTPVMGSPQHRPQMAGGWQGQTPGKWLFIIFRFIVNFYFFMVNKFIHFLIFLY